MTSCEQIAELLSGYLDAELTQRDRQRVEVHIDSCPECRRTFDEMSLLRQSVGELPFGRLTPQEWSKMMNDLPVRTSRGIGWLLFVAGTVVLVGYSIYEFAIDETVPALVKSGTAAIVFGLVCLFLSVLRQRLIARQSDPYQDVQL